MSWCDFIICEMKLHSKIVNWMYRIFKYLLPAFLLRLLWGIVNRNMNTETDIINILKSVFNKSVESVTPHALFNQSKCLEKLSTTTPTTTTTTTTTTSITKSSNNAENITMEIKINDGGKENYEIIKIRYDQQCHLIGFGKAVLGMACEVEKMLGNKLKYGILSVPFGTVEKFKTNINMQLKENSCIEVYEGAKNNIPDTDAELTARKIKNYVEKLTENDILFVLISGGGSALLPIPKYPITLDEKINIIKLLAGRGATINELNTVRIDISDIKGGKLLEAAKNSSQIISLIISDVINDPLDIIASGPTTIPPHHNTTNCNNDRSHLILKRYNLWDSLSNSIKMNIPNPNDKNYIAIDNKFKNEILQKSSSYIIGNNRLAIDTAVNEMKNYNYKCIYLTKEIQGNIIDISKGYCKLSMAIKNYFTNAINENDLENIVAELKPILKIRYDFFKELQLLLSEKVKTKGLCVIGGGETIVNLNNGGSVGQGGRNQELALRFAHDCYANKQLNDLYFLSAGTDGIDGPTDAAGAIGNFLLIDNFIKTYAVDKLQQYIENNDSYNFFNNHQQNNKYHIITGHTGTNVMDIHILMIPI